ncbi:MAG: hypothetical protein RIS29_2628 [Bacteroidota bacterium]|jgi:uncharacterized membrane protein
MKSIRIGLIICALVLLISNFIILFNNNENSSRIGLLLMAISMICVVISSIFSLIQVAKKRK